MSAGYMGRSLHVDLTTGVSKPLRIDAREFELYMGGKGIGTRLLYDYTQPGMDPFDPEMPLIFSTGPVTGTNAPQSNRFVVTTKSPLTGAVGTATCGGNFATKLKQAGYDVLMITGRAEHPVTLEITEEGATIHDARPLWGLETTATQDKLPKRHGKAVIGPAGENLVRFACILSQDRLAGRTGVGAVMGSKKLKAVIAFGKRRVEIMEPDTFKEFQRKHSEFLLNHPQTGGTLKKLGTPSMVMNNAGRNIMPTRNFQSGTDPQAPRIAGERIAVEKMLKNVGCRACPISCGRLVEVDGKRVKGPEFETVVMLGSDVGNFDLDRLLHFNVLADELGMDSISLGNTIAFACELAEKGMLDADLRFGDLDAIERLIVDTAHRRDLGAEVAEGSKRMSEKYGGAEFAMHVKGLELPGYDPRGAWGQGLEYATTNRGGCHVQGYTIYLEATGPFTVNPHSIKAKPELVMLQQNLNAAISSMVMCYFSTYPMIPGLAFDADPNGVPFRLMQKLVLHSGPLVGLLLKAKAPLRVLWFEKFLTYVLGRKFSIGELLEVGNRVFNMERAFNLREGFSAADDTLPARILRESNFKDYKAQVPLDRMLPKYYRLRGWDEDGRIRDRTIERLGIRL